MRHEAKNPNLWNRQAIKTRRRTLVFFAGHHERFRDWDWLNWDIPGVRIPRSARAVRKRKLLGLECPSRENEQILREIIADTPTEGDVFVNYPEDLVDPAIWPQLEAEMKTWSVVEEDEGPEPEFLF